jgi:hypothetical protein
MVKTMRRILVALALLWLAEMILLAQNQIQQLQLSVKIVQHSVVLSWTASATTNVLGYNVYRSATSGSGYNKVGSVTVPTLTYTDQSTLAGQTYYFVVTAYAQACPQTTPCGESAYSNEVKVVVPTP